ncbi:HTH-type transcriptional repressor CarH [Deinococcus aetherius]|uniref:HTH-type transcriptional repressor CarH n=1 Tax=Deinococcus aetherius TaxID=200252 RepID=A0ABM8AAN3_9DEIO|nr:B12-binding domain-containing protein [Deinococcus aetherius]BDP40777.1 HTH-type transcriptional repressor CarH [Deinococcus aetherius]
MEGSSTPPGTATDTTAMFTASEVESRVGVPAATLRQWERRYGFPSPARSASGYRLYSPHDLALIEVMQSHLRAGVPAGRAAQLTLASAGPEGAAGEPVVRESTASHLPVGALAPALLEALAGGNLTQAGRVLAQAHAHLPLEDVLTGVVSPALAEIGRLWERGDITVAHEHRASAFLRARLEALLDAAGVEGEFGPRVIAACAPGEQHELGLMMISLVLRRRGVQTEYLGANMPLGDLMVYARQRRADAVLIALNGDWALGPTRAQRRDLDGLEVPVFYGGALLNAHPDLAAELGGRYAGPDVVRAADLITAHLHAVRAGGA